MRLSHQISKKPYALVIAAEQQAGNEEGTRERNSQIQMRWRYFCVF